MSAPLSLSSAPQPAAGLYFEPLQLIEFARFYADEIVAGKYPFVDYDADERWHQRLYRDRRIDIWLISWLPTQGTELHDHGGSSGAFTVLSGALTETVVSGRSHLLDHERTAGDSAGFGPHYVHDVRNTSTRPAVSVHAYSAPLTTMNFYDLTDTGLVRLAALATDDPEPTLGTDGVRAGGVRAGGVRQAS